MNKYQARGIAIYFIGRAQEGMGRITGNQRQQAKGFEKRMIGKAKIAIGDAQEIIKTCVKR
jgi:uncharacterized protein YjbJ (UPF0337 family)